MLSYITLRLDLGTLVNAEIHLGTRNVLEHLLLPMQEVAHEAGRERGRVTAWVANGPVANRPRLCKNFMPHVHADVPVYVVTDVTAYVGTLR